MTEFVQNLIDGIGRGSIYALLALGVAVIFGVMHLLNFAHGELITISGYAAYAAFTSGCASASARLAFSAAAACSRKVGAPVSFETVTTHGARVHSRSSRSTWVQRSCGAPGSTRSSIRPGS